MQTILVHLEHECTQPYAYKVFYLNPFSLTELK